jgi:hypothetical protein
MGPLTIVPAKKPVAPEAAPPSEAPSEASDAAAVGGAAAVAAVRAAPPPPPVLLSGVELPGVAPAEGLLIDLDKQYLTATTKKRHSSPAHKVSDAGANAGCSAGDIATPADTSVKAPAPSHLSQQGEAVNEEPSDAIQALAR